MIPRISIGRIIAAVAAAFAAMRGFNDSAFTNKPDSGDSYAFHDVGRQNIHSTREHREESPEIA